MTPEGYELTGLKAEYNKVAQERDNLKYWLSEAHALCRRSMQLNQALSAFVNDEKIKEAIRYDGEENVK